MKRLFISFFLLLTTYYLLPTAIYAQITNPVLPTNIGSGGPDVGGTIVGSIIGGVIALFFIVGAVAAFIFLLIGALRWIASTGDKTKLQAAQDQITQAIIGLLIMAAVWGIMTVITSFLGIGTFGPAAGVFTLPSLNQTTQPPLPFGPPGR